MSPFRNVGKTVFIFTGHGMFVVTNALERPAAAERWRQMPRHHCRSPRRGILSTFQTLPRGYLECCVAQVAHDIDSRILPNSQTLHSSESLVEKY